MGVRVENDTARDEKERDMEATTKPTCKLVGTNGNVFVIIANVCRALKAAGLPDRAKEFTAKAFKAGSYDAVLALCFDYVDVE
jgi:hypothetical protein